MSKFLLTIFTFIGVCGLNAQESMFAYKLGAMEVWTVVEVTGRGTKSILLDETPEQKDYVSQKIPTGSYTHETNFFIVRSEGKFYLFDTGFGTGRAAVDSLASLGAKPDQVAAIFITHTHGDHTGGLVKDNYPQFPGAALYISKNELAAWQASPSEAAKIRLYRDRIKTFEPVPLSEGGVEVIPGINAAAAEGHTAGHVCYILRQGKRSMLIAGDFIHVEDVQFGMPSISVTYDANRDKAGLVRRDILEYAAKNSVPIAGMHLRYPGIVTVKADKSGGFVWTPVK
ncbi:MAG: MBL fold metallo-hydrolase [Spirochaetaceae bacterium]|jgi:glyoxylase-like metal-dependent hydrolase (beta-lactamase superfamily II)|nr:MBL fold metallo-hydrolase [Spirochaetaceae bacterium]